MRNWRRPRRLSSSSAPSEALLDSNVFLSYLKDDEFAEHAESVVFAAVEGRLHAYASSALYDDVITALRSKEYPLSEAKAAIRGIAAIPHVSLAMTPEIALTALDLYEKNVGSRKLHYFDAFHVATAVHHRLPLITSDTYIIANMGALNMRAINLRKITL